MKPRRGLARLIWAISIPILFAEWNEIVLHVTNTIFLARVGVTELGAIAIADTILELFLVLPLGLVDGIQILTARQVGRRRPRAAGEAFNQGLTLIFGLSLVLAAVLWAGSSGVSRLLVRSQDVGTAVSAFLQISAIGLPLSAATFAYSALLVSLGRTRALIPATILLTLTNCVLDYVLIFGKLGFPALGMRGAAWASIGSELVVTVFLTAYLLTAIDARRYGLFRLRSWNPKLTRVLLRISGPVSLQAMVEGVRWLVFFLIVERIGAGALAVANVVYACYEIFRVPTEAFGETACSVVSRLIGREQEHRVGSAVRHAIRSAAVVTLPFVALGLLLPDWVLSIFTLDEGLLQNGMASLRVVALAMLIIIPGEMWFTAVVGTGDTPAALGIEVVLTVVMLAISYFAAVAFSGRLELVWVSLPAAWLVCLAASYAWMRLGIWRRLAI